MAIQDDISIAVNGDIRYTGSGTNYTVIALHRWLGNLMDDAQAAGNDILDITDATASERSTDNIITLNSPYNIDNELAKHLYDGSVIQDSGNTIYDGIVVYAPTGTYLFVMQNGNIASPNFWTTGLNADSANGISHRFMLKVRTGGNDIDGRRLIGITREWGYTYSEFKINGTARGNNVMALSSATDLNNTTTSLTSKGWTGVTNTGGYRGIDVDNNTVNEYYYSEWNRATYTINQFYERMKWLSQRSPTESICSDTGSNFAVGNGTITAQGQSFTDTSNNAYLTRAFASFKKVGTPTGIINSKVYAHSGSFGASSVPTGGALAISKDVDVSKLTTSYQTIEFGFDTQYEMVADTNYVIVFDSSAGNASNYAHLQGLASSGTHPGNRSSYDGSWTATAGDDLNFRVDTSPKLYNIAGERFRGITHEVNLTTPRSGDFNATELVSWGSGATAGIGTLVAIDSSNVGTKMWIQTLSGVPPSASVTITGTTTGAIVTNTGSPTERSLSFPFCGSSTGSAIIGSYGFGLEATDLTANDKVFDLTNTQVSPPNYVTFTVGGLVVSEDRVLVGPATGGVLQTGQFTLATTLSGGGEIAVVVGSAIPSDTPSSGTIRIELNSGIYRRVAYTSYTGSTFTIGSTDFTSDNATSGNDVYISYIDKLATATSESFTSVFSAERSLFIRIRDGGTAGDLIPIKTFETTGTLGSAGGSSTVIRTSDA